MAKITYEDAFSDHDYLWSVYGPADDMTGGYVDQEDLTRLLRSPTKATARDCLIRQIEYWFLVGPDKTHSHQESVSKLIAENSMLRDIAIRYNIIEDEDFEDDE